ncbi:MAG: cell division transport system permease protein [Actinomycetota bacterium]|jgi:cell division transport system permease protein|nr:cell division transport system permease protein [Actinomycetota bacterium]MDQ1643404.1 cell division transport system permease protein [Actinomycetota bacterium]
MRASFILSEIGIGLRRNLTMTIAVIVTTAVSLAFFGFGLLFNRQVDTMKGFWYDKVEVSVFLCGQDSSAPSCAAGEVSQAQRDQIESELRAMPEVKNVFYESKQQAFTRFKQQFKDSAISDNITADQMPESFRVKLKDPQQFPIVATAFAGRDGIEQVQDQKALLEKFFRVLNALKLGAWGLAGVMIVVAVLLISNTIRVAAFSRRRETGIMKLVGASSFSIQLPFLLEGAIAGLIGASLATGALATFQWLVVENQARPNFPFTDFVSWGDMWRTVPAMVLLGVALAALASFFTLRKYLRV